LSLGAEAVTMSNQIPLGSSRLEGHEYPDSHGEYEDEDQRDRPLRLKHKETSLREGGRTDVGQARNTSLFNFGLPAPDSTTHLRQMHEG
jgi:hypothetical protein